MKQSIQAKLAKKKHTHKWVLATYVTGLWMSGESSDWEGHYDRASWVCECGTSKIHIYRDREG